MERPSTISHLFEPQSTSPVLLSELPTLIEPIVEFIADNQPEHIIGLDRGARFACLAIFKAWKHRYPEQRFPTLTNTIQFCGVSKDLPASDNTAKLTSHIQALNSKRPALSVKPFNVMFIDDWVQLGETTQQAIHAAKTCGLSASQIAVATLCGNSILDPEVTHIIGDATRATVNSEWNAYEEMLGVPKATESSFEYTDRTQAKQARDKISLLVARHFSPQDIAKNPAA